jgi:hypothetical protein
MITPYRSLVSRLLHSPFAELWAAATFTLSADGCDPDHYKVVIDQTWGPHTLSLTDNMCAPATPYEADPGRGSYVLEATATLRVPSDANGLFTDTADGGTLGALTVQRYNAVGGNLVVPRVLRIALSTAPVPPQTTTTIGAFAALSPTLADFAADVALGNYKSAPLIIWQLPQ